jgi:hypothetical protein
MVTAYIVQRFDMKVVDGFDFWKGGKPVWRIVVLSRRARFLLF